MILVSAAAHHASRTAIFILQNLFFFRVVTACSIDDFLGTGSQSVVGSMPRAVPHDPSTTLQQWSRCRGLVRCLWAMQVNNSPALH
ncbi:hypothetical protein E2C01_028983 [Portunus trituberculatus]|uniref:Secreted protein n=1 Tax=Portunus trituberculatus TaxID=210409 RepID=A0A5B7EQK4_PORTR|nr:hypothetical protein [Portunus trituberculatus]